LQNYITFIKSNIDKHLKLLNLKYNGYLIKYETEIPRLIYDRIFNGIIIKFYISDDDCPEICQTYDHNFKDDILSDSLKQRIDYVVKDLSSTHDLLLKVLKVLQTSNKIINYKLNYKENTDYIDSIYFEDYRNKCFVLNKKYYYIKDFKRYNEFVFKDLIKDDIILLKLPYDKDFCILETKNLYEFKSVYYNFNFIRYKFNLIKQENINISYFYMDKYLPRYNFVKATLNLENILIKIENKIGNIKENFVDTEYFNKIYIEDEFVEIFDIEINKTLEQLLYPMIYLSNKCNTNTLSIRFNKEFTKNEFGKLQLWLIKDFIDVLNRLGVSGICNIK
jgi:hypothetical protein